MAAGFSLKDQLFNADKVAGLATRFGAADPGFDASGFEADVMSRLLDLELKERIAWIADCLGRRLPGDFDGAGAVILAALPAPLDPEKTDDDFGDFIYAPLGEVVVARGLDGDPEAALGLLAEITQRFSMEWSVRPFLNRWPEETLAVMEGWVAHPNYHVRRLVSEGTRPRLPWGAGIDLPLERPLPLLDRLAGDPTRYVTRSVANHVNDITKKDPGLAMDRLATWAAEAGQGPEEMAWMVAHALRGLVKAGDGRAMRMIGFDPDAPVDLVALEMPGAVRIGEKMKISVTLAAPQPAGALVDYLFWRLRADGSRTAKVQKMKQVRLAADAPVTLVKTHVLKGDATTYRLYPGMHRIEIQVNGRVVGGRDFELRDA